MDVDVDVDVSVSVSVGQALPPELVVAREDLVGPLHAQVGVELEGEYWFIPADTYGAVDGLMAGLLEIRVVIACGLVAQKGWLRHVAAHRPDIAAIRSWHPSPLQLNQPGKRNELRAAMQQAADFVK